MATEKESALYRQSATYRHFVVLYNLRALGDWAVNEDAYKAIKKAMSLLNKLESSDFAEDENGKIIADLLPAYKPEWKD